MTVWHWLLILAPLALLYWHVLGGELAPMLGPWVRLVGWWGGVGCLVVLGYVLTQSLEAFRPPSGKGDPAFSPIIDLDGIGIVLAQTLATIAPIVAALGWVWAGWRLDWRRGGRVTWLVCAAWIVPTAAAWAWVHDHGPYGQLTDAFWEQYQFRLIRQGGQIVSARWDEGPRFLTPVPDEALERLSRLPDLAEVDLGCSGLTDDDLRYLARLPKLRKLDLVSCRRITDAGIEHLRGHPSLEELDLKGTAVTDACIPALLSMPKLRRFIGNSGSREDGMTTAAAYKLYDELQKRPRPGP